MRARGRKGCVWLWALAVGWHASAGDVSGAGVAGARCCSRSHVASSL